MNFTDDGYAAMLLTMALSPNREEYARPYSTQEFRAIEAGVRASRYGDLGRLLNADVSGLMMYLNMTEQEALRAYTLLHRTVQLSYALEKLQREGVEVVTCRDGDYPARLAKRLGEAAPAFFYYCGDLALLSRPAIAIVGIGGVRTDDAVKGAVDRLVRAAAERGYAVVTGGEPGVSRVAANALVDGGGALVDVLGGALLEHIHLDGIAELIAEGRGAALSMDHPEAPFTAVHAAARNKPLFALAEAAFVFNTDGRRGELGILQNRYCDNVYAWRGCAENAALIARGATPFGPGDTLDFDALRERWRAGEGEQLSVFDLI